MNWEHKMLLDAAKRDIDEARREALKLVVDITILELYEKTHGAPKTKANNKEEGYENS